MIVVRAPLRISFLGGGTDYPEFFNNYTGIVLGSSIDKYVYVFANKLPLQADQHIRFNYRKVESVHSYEDLEHPVLRAAIPFVGYLDSLNMATMSDIAGSSGLGSSSAFSVATLKALESLINLDSEPMNLARKAVQLEREIMQESGGWQDQYISAVGGFRSFTFFKSDVTVSKPLLSPDILAQFSKSVILVPVGTRRLSSQYAAKTAKTASETNGTEQLVVMSKIAQRVTAIIENLTSIDDFIEVISDAINTTWAIKRNLAEGISNNQVDDLIDYGIRSGCTAAKLCGAGGSGYVLFVTPARNASYFNSCYFKNMGIEVNFTDHGAQFWSLDNK